jgi:ketosteroid isomerase-like protein
MSHRQLALEVVAQLATGMLDRALFTDDATWWSNTGQTFSLEEFLGILAALHPATVSGIKIDTGLVVENDDTVIVEATSNVPLVNGAVYSNRYIFLVHFSAGRIREVKEYNDTAHLQECFAFLSEPTNIAQR